MNLRSVSHSFPRLLGFCTSFFYHWNLTGKAELAEEARIFPGRPVPLDERSCNSSRLHLVLYIQDVGKKLSTEYRFDCRYQYNKKKVHVRWCHSSFSFETMNKSVLCQKFCNLHVSFRSYIFISSVSRKMEKMRWLDRIFMQIPIFMNMIKKWIFGIENCLIHWIPQKALRFRFYIKRILCIFASSNFSWTYQNPHTSDKVTNTVF